MLKDLYESMQKFFTDQAKVKAELLPFTNDKRVKYYWDPDTRTVHEMREVRPDNRHRLLSVSSVIAYVNNLEAEIGTNVWVSRDSIKIECVENDPKDIVSLTLEFDPMFKLLQKLQSRPSIAQSEAIKLLRQRFQEFDPAGRALTAARAFKVNRSDDTSHEQTQSLARAGKLVTQTASGAGDLPEFIDVVSPVFQNFAGVGRAIRVWTSIDLNTPGHMIFEPDEKQMEQAIRQEREEIIGVLRDEFKGLQVSVYEGEYLVS